MAHTTQTVNALIIRENNAGEADRFITALTDECGIIHASVRGARNPKNRQSAGTRLLCCSRLTLIPGREHYIVETALPSRVFFDLFGDIEKLALAQYFCELAGSLAPAGEPAPEFLRLFLNALHLLEQGRPPLQIKAVTELRALSYAGYMPHLTGCVRCGKTEENGWLFSALSGSLFCADCAPRDAKPIPDGVLSAMCHILRCEDAKIFSFRLAPDQLGTLADISESFLLTHRGKSFKTLDFYRSLS